MLTSETFGNRIKELRAARGLSQQQLADKMFVARGAVANWEAGRRLPDVSMVARLATCLGVDAYALFDALREPDEPPSLIVVDDEPVILTGCVHVLDETMPDAEIVGFRKASEAAEFARSNRVAVAFLDIELSSDSGIGLAERLTEIDPRTNIIFLTCHPEYMGAALDLHCSGYLMKPLTPEKIRRELSHLRFPVPGLSL